MSPEERIDVTVLVGGAVVRTFKPEGWIFTVSAASGETP